MSIKVAQLRPVSSTETLASQLRLHMMCVPGLSVCLSVCLSVRNRVNCAGVPAGLNSCQHYNTQLTSLFVSGGSGGESFNGVI